MRNITETKKVNRNDSCWCGSGKKYKKCHLKEDEKPKRGLASFLPKTKRKIYRSEEFVEGMEEACKLAKATLEMVGREIREGVTSNHIDELVYDYTMDHGAYPAPLNYHGFPKSVCVSINEVICHGIPSERVIQDGDIVNVDVTPRLNGFHGDTNATFLVGNVSEEAKKVVRVSRECLDKAIEVVTPYSKMGDIGAIIQKYAHSQGCSVVEKFVGHGIGHEFHEDPQVPHFGTRGSGITLVPGMFFTIEPMINLGTKEVIILGDEWTAISADGKLSAQFEHTLYLTETGVRVLTR